MGLPFLARVRNRRARSDCRAAVGALGELGGARGAGDEVVARPEEDGPRRVGFHADRAQEAVLERLLLTLDLDERAGRRVRRCLERLEAGRGRLTPRFLYIGVGHGLLLLAADALVEVVEACAEIITFTIDATSAMAWRLCLGPAGSGGPGRARTTPRPQSKN